MLLLIHNIHTALNLNNLNSLEVLDSSFSTSKSSDTIYLNLEFVNNILGETIPNNFMSLFLDNQVPFSF